MTEEQPISATPGAPSPDAPPRVASWFARWRQRVKATAAVLALYTVLATAVMAPLSSPCLPSSGAQDIANHVSGVIEARNALAEGQFPVRVAPHQNDGTRYPIFQFYGNLPYTAAALLCLAARANPYHAWKLAVTAALVLGAFFTYAAARLLTRQGLPAAAAGAVFLTAPYLLTDIHGRFAYPEIISFCLLPLLFWSLLRSFSSPELSRILVSGVAWAALALSHNITYVYASTFFALFFLSYFRLTWKYVGRMCGLAAGFALGLLLTAWYVAPQLVLLPHLLVTGESTVWGCSWLTPLGVLLAPTMTLPVLLPTPLIEKTAHFGLQVGWPILAAIGTSLYALADAQVPRRWRRATMTRLLLAFGLAFLLVWSPFNFWRYLPGLFHFVQFSYRLLMFVVCGGAGRPGRGPAVQGQDDGPRSWPPASRCWVRWPRPVSVPTRPVSPPPSSRRWPTPTWAAAGRTSSTARRPPSWQRRPACITTATSRRSCPQRAHRARVFCPPRELATCCGSRGWCPIPALSRSD